MSHRTMKSINQGILACDLCPRLLDHCQQIARQKRAAYRQWDYHGLPVVNFGKASARLLVVGLAPGAHGANRTGRMFTGDRSGDFLYRAMHEAGFANQALCTDANDGLQLIDALITAAVHCAPPGNKPNSTEFGSCAKWLDQTFDAMKDLRVIVGLGKLAFNSVLRLYKRRGWISKLSPYPFGHGVEHHIEGTAALIGSYHPSQQNTFTGKLTDRMLLDVFRRAAALIEA